LIAEKKPPRVELRMNHLLIKLSKIVGRDLKLKKSGPKVKDN